MKFFFLITTIFLLFSCSTKDVQFCECLKVGDKLNKVSSTLLNKPITPKIQKEMQVLKAKKKSICKNYQTMGGEKMLELKAECK